MKNEKIYIRGNMQKINWKKCANALAKCWSTFGRNLAMLNVDRFCQDLAEGYQHEFVAE